MVFQSISDLVGIAVTSFLSRVTCVLEMFVTLLVIANGDG